MNGTRTYLILLYIVISIELIAGGGWVKGKGEGYYKLGYSFVQNNGYYGPNGLFLPKLQTSFSSASVYLEQGLSKGLSAELYLPFYTKHSVTGKDTLGLSLNDDASGIGDANLGLRVSLWQRDYFALSGSLTLGLPLGSATLGREDNLFTGDDEFNQLLKLNGSVPFGTKKISGYGTVYVGYNNRSDFFSDEFHYGAEAGISLMKKKMWIIGRVNAIDAPSSVELENATNGFINSMSFTSYGAEVSFNTGENTGFSVSYTGLIDGNILLVEPAYAIGIYMDIK